MCACIRGSSHCLYIQPHKPRRPPRPSPSSSPHFTSVLFPIPLSLSLSLSLSRTMAPPAMPNDLSNSWEVTDFVVNQGHGVKGLSEMGLESLPKQFIQPLEEQMLLNKVVLEESIPVIDVSNWDDPKVVYNFLVLFCLKKKLQISYFVLKRKWYSYKKINIENITRIICNDKSHILLHHFV